MWTRVSNIESFRQWREDEDQTPQDLVDRLTQFEPSEPMLAGTAFHKALEDSQPGEYDTLAALGYTFHLTEGEIAIPDIRELRASKAYGPLRVSGQVDALCGLRVEDHKTTGRCDPDRYMAGCQWRFYLDIFRAEIFRWNIFEIKLVGVREYQVKAPQVLEQFRYPGMEQDCMKLAQDFHAFAVRFLPDHNAIPEAA